MEKKKITASLVALIVCLLLFDQWSKWYVKTHFFLGEEVHVFGSWFRIHFIENEGMAFGMTWGGNVGKLLLTLFRVIAVVLGFFWLRRIWFKENYPIGFAILVALIYAGALGNTIDSLVYGLIFDESTHLHKAILFPEDGGYTSLFYGKVVDMIYVPMIQTHLPTWFPFGKGNYVEFFSPVFNIADACVSTGTFGILVFYRRYISNRSSPKTTTSDSDKIA